MGHYSRARALELYNKNDQQRRSRNQKNELKLYYFFFFITSIQASISNKWPKKPLQEKKIDLFLVLEPDFECKIGNKGKQIKRALSLFRFSLKMY